MGLLDLRAETARVKGPMMIMLTLEEDIPGLLQSSKDMDGEDIRRSNLDTFLDFKLFSFFGHPRFSESVGTGIFVLIIGNQCVVIKVIIWTNWCNK